MAIAFGASADLGDNLSTASFSGTGPTVSGVNTYGIVIWDGDVSGGHDDITSTTWGGVNMTLFAKIAGSRFLYLYGVPNPSSAATIAVNSTNAHFWSGVCGYYTRVLQTGQPDSTNTGSTASATSLTVADTVVNAGSWLIAAMESGDTSGPPTTTTGSVRQTETAGFVWPTLLDSNAALSAGSHNFTVTIASATANSISLALAALIPDTALYAPPRRLARTYYLPVILTR